MHGHVGENPRVKRTFCSRRPRTPDRTVSHIKAPSEMSLGPPYFNLIEYLALGLRCPFHVIETLSRCAPILFVTNQINYICSVVVPRNAQKLSLHCGLCSEAITQTVPNGIHLTITSEIPNCLWLRITWSRTGRKYALRGLLETYGCDRILWSYWADSRYCTMPQDGIGRSLEKTIEAHVDLVCTQGLSKTVL
jgi:hypothetical protein